MFCCGATASRTAPLITQTVEHGHNPVLTSQYTHTFGSATLFEARAGGIYIRDNFTPVSDDFVTPGRTDQATGFSSVNGLTGSKQFHNRTTVDASVSHSASDFLKGSHDFKFGVQTAYATQRTVSIRFSNVSYTDLNAAPYLATFQDPSASGGRIRTAGGYAAGQLDAQRPGHAQPRRALRPDHAATSPSSRPARRSTASPAMPSFDRPEQHHLSGGRGSDRVQHLVAARRHHHPRRSSRARRW